jgi:hypothetical protein
MKFVVMRIIICWRSTCKLHDTHILLLVHIRTAWWYAMCVFINPLFIEFCIITMLYITLKCLFLKLNKYYVCFWLFQISVNVVVHHIFVLLKHTYLHAIVLGTLFKWYISWGVSRRNKWYRCGCIPCYYNHQDNKHHLSIIFPCTSILPETWKPSTIYSAQLLHARTVFIFLNIC